MRLGWCARCTERRYLHGGICPACLQEMKAAAEEEIRVKRTIESFVGELDKPEAELWKELGL